MVSASGRFVLIFNGEIYNFAELRAALGSEGGRDWRGSSDTEMLLASIEPWGIIDALMRARVMFALGLWDRPRRMLSLERDSAGEKPLYFGPVGRSVDFASELKAIAAHPGWQGEIDRDAVALCLRVGHVPARRRLWWCAVRNVMPGMVLTLSGGIPTPRPHPVETFWEMFAEAERTPLTRSVRRQMVADVPLGALLSGGIDSSAIAALAQESSDRPISTSRSASSRRAPAEFAKAIAGHLWTVHNEIYLAGKSASDLLASMPDVYDEPIATQLAAGDLLAQRLHPAEGDGSAIRRCRGRAVRGYDHYGKGRHWEGGPVSGLARRAELAGLVALDEGLLAVLQGAGVRWALGGKCQGLADPGRVPPRDGIGRHSHRGLRGALHRHRTRARAGPGRRALPQTAPGTDRRRNWLERARAGEFPRHDALLLGDVLVKVDRAAMAHSLETRLPFLDPDVIRFAFSLRDDLKLMGGEPKGALRNLLARHVPRGLWGQAEDWLRCANRQMAARPLAPLASDLFSRETLRRTSILDEARVTALWSAFRRGSGVRPKVIWTLFMTQLFLERHRPTPGHGCRRAPGRRGRVGRVKPWFRERCRCRPQPS